MRTSPLLPECARFRRPGPDERLRVINGNGQTLSVPFNFETQQKSDIMLPLLFLGVSSIIEYDPAYENFFKKGENPLAALFYDSTRTNVKRELRVFERVSTLLYKVDFVQCDCGKYPSVCQNMFVDPLPGVRLWSIREEPHEFTNEHSVYAIMAFIRSHAKGAVSLITKNPDNMKSINASNYGQFVSNSGCNIIAYMMPRDRMSKMLYPTLRELADIFQDDEDVNFGEVNCSDHMPFCKHAGINAAPIIRVYKDGNYTDYTETRELVYLLEFINQKCGKNRNEEGEIEIPKTKLTLSECIKFASADASVREAMANEADEMAARTMRQIIANGTQIIDSGLKMCDNLLSKPINSIAKEKVKLEKEILEMFNEAFNKQEL